MSLLFFIKEFEMANKLNNKDKSLTLETLFDQAAERIGGPLNKAQKVSLIDELIKKAKLPNGKEISLENIQKLMEAKAVLSKQDIPTKMMTIEDLRAQFGKRTERAPSGTYIQEATKVLVKTLENSIPPKQRKSSKDSPDKKKKAVVNLWKK